MKILSIDKLDYARFRNFTWDKAVSVFGGTTNILFGWNGSGKTTISNLLRGIETKTLESSVKYKIALDTGPVTNSSDPNPLQGNVRVFNLSYVKDMLLGSSAIPHIFYAGSDAVSFEKEETKLAEMKLNLTKMIVPNDQDEIAKNTAPLIKGVTGINAIKKDLTRSSTYANYSKGDFEKRIEDITTKIGSAKIHSASDLIKADIDDLKKFLVNAERFEKIDQGIANISTWLIENIDGINKILESKPIQLKSQRIDTMPSARKEWVKTGFDIHSAPEKLTHCLFCGSEIKNYEELEKHFSKEVVTVIDALDSYVAIISQHSTFVSSVESPTEVQKERASKLDKNLSSLKTALAEKRKAIGEAKGEVSLDIKELGTWANVSVTDVANVAYDIEKHYVAEKYDSYVKAKKESEEAQTKKNAAQAEMAKLEQEVIALRQKANNTHEAAKALSRLFSVVFPYRKIEITESPDGRGYALKRDDVDCPFFSLSEGEKNFIALSYFIFSLNDSQSKFPEDGIVVIDDPVSSLDKQAIFQIYSMIVSEITKHPNRQYFLLTHNFDFLNHLKEHFDDAIKSGNIPMYGLLATENGCKITTIDPLLKNHRSDYYYVFSVLNNYKDRCDLKDAQLIVNLLRRWLETFLEFKLSISGNLRGAIESAYAQAAEITKRYKTPFSANSLEMYRFINHGSHAFPDTNTMDDSVLTNAHTRIQEAFTLVEILDPMHYKKLLSRLP